MCRRMRKVSFKLLSSLSLLFSLWASGSCRGLSTGNRGWRITDFDESPAPEPKPKKNRELKTEILPVTVTPVQTPDADD